MNEVRYSIPIEKPDPRYQEVLRTLIGALSTIHDVSAPQQQRQLAQQV